MLFALLLAIASASPVPSATATPTPAPTPAPPTYVGVYLQDVSGFDLKEGRFHADMQVWAKWLGPAEPPAIDFENGEVEVRDLIASESDGDWRSARWRVQGTFRGTFPLHRFPFDEQRLPIVIGSRSGGVLVPDLAASGMAPEFSITGWLYEPWFKAKQSGEMIASDLGSVLHEGDSHTGSSVTFAVELRRPFIAYLVKFMLPLAIILGMASLAAWLPSADAEARAGMGVTALLACVAFHFTQADSLPDVSYLVAADKLFLGAYVLVLVTVVGTVAAYRMHETAPARALLVDRVVRVVVPVVAIVGSITLVARSRVPEDKTAEPATPALAAASPGATPTASPVASRDELRVGVTALPGLNSSNISELLRRGLVHDQPDGSRVPHLVDLAPEMTNERVRFLPDGGMLVIWKLKRGLRWSDGKPLTSDDVVFTLSQSDYPNRAGMRAIDARTVEVRYRVRRAGDIEGFSLYQRAAHEALFKEKGREGLIEAFAKGDPGPGTGPYVLESFEAGKSAVFRRNEWFAGKRPAIGTIRFRVYPDALAVAEGLRAGEVDLVPSLGFRGAAMMTSGTAGAATHVAVKSQQADVLSFLQPDLHVPPFDRVEVRQAMAMAIDRDKVAKTQYGPNGIVAHTYRDEGAKDFAADVTRWRFDRAGARKLLAGIDLPAKTMLLHSETPAGSPADLALAQIESDLEAVGFRVERKAVKTTTDLLRNANHGGLLSFARRDTTSVSSLWNVPYENGRYRLVAGKGVIDAALEAQLERYENTHFDERKAVVSRRLQRAFAERLPVVPIAFGDRTAGHVKALDGFGMGGETTFWWNVEEWRLAP